jgi:hypothetical protein
MITISSVFRNFVYRPPFDDLRSFHLSVTTRQRTRLCVQVLRLHNRKRTHLETQHAHDHACEDQIAEPLIVIGQGGMIGHSVSR